MKNIFGIILIAIMWLMVACNPKQASKHIKLEGKMAELEKEAQNGDMEALYYLGVEYYNGAKEHPSWSKEAIRCLERAAAEGKIGGAYYHLSICYQLGKGCERNYDKAIVMACKGADLDMIESKYEAAKLLILYGDVHDPITAHKAFSYAKEAAAEYYPDAWELLGQMYLEGIGTAKDAKEGSRWLERAYRINDDQELDSIPII